MDRVWVDLSDRSYPIHIGENLLSRVGEILRRSGASGKVMVITNPTVSDLYMDGLLNGLKGEEYEVFWALVPDGEEFKTLKWASRLYDSLLENRMERSSTIVALGGGVIGDVAGFAAATFKRGLHFVQAPTTLLAQVDASIGGKVAVDHPRGKNLIGAFYQPRCVIISPDVLRTLPERELKSGLAEVIKYGIIKDKDLFEYLEENLGSLLKCETDKLRFMVKRSCQIKASVVSRDEREQGLRAMLNFGHTIGHAIEAASDYRRYRHGEAVAIGMVCATDIAVELRMTSKETLDRIVGLVERSGLPTGIEGTSAEKILKFIHHDKKIHDGRIRFVLPKSIGEVVITDAVPEEVIGKKLKERSA